MPISGNGNALSPTGHHHFVNSYTYLQQQLNQQLKESPSYADENKRHQSVAEMLNHTSITQDSPTSEDTNDDQPLDFSQKAQKLSVKQEPVNLQKPLHAQTLQSHVQTTTTASNLSFTTPSPSPPEQQQAQQQMHNTTQVLCQLLTGNLVPTSSGKVIPARNHPPSSVAVPATPFNGIGSASPISRSPPTAVMQGGRVTSERVNSTISPTESLSPIGLGPLNQIDMMHITSPNSGVDRFNTSGGLLTTATPHANQSAYPPGDAARRAYKYNRPFKAYPRDPLSIPMGYCGVPFQMPLSADAIATQSLLATASDQAYLQFREQMMVQRKQSDKQQRTTSTTKSLNNNSSSASSPPANNNSNHGNCTSMNTNANGNHLNAYPHQSVTPHKDLSLAHNASSNINGSASLANSDDNSNGNCSSGGEMDNNNISEESMPTGPVNGGGQLADQGGMRKRGRPLPEDLKDDAYWERRRKNNEAAKRSRDARRAKEDEIAIRAAFLEQENLKLRVEVAALKSETAKLRCMLYNN